MKLQTKSYYFGTAVPLQVWGGADGSRKLRFPDFMTTVQDGGKVVSLTHWPPLPPRKYSWYSFLLEVESTQGPQCVPTILNLSIVKKMISLELLDYRPKLL